MTVEIRPQSRDDADAIHAVHLAAFPEPLEAELVRALQSDGDAEISLVAVAEGRVVGHVLLSRMAVEGDGRTYRALGLAPIAVLLNYQRRGIAAALIEQALAQAGRNGEQMVFVLGEPAYYARFGFALEIAAPFASPYAGPYFMAKSFGAPRPSAGSAAYAPAFARRG
jgi:putative acetyltransferase